MSESDKKSSYEEGTKLLIAAARPSPRSPLKLNSHPGSPFAATLAANEAGKAAMNAIMNQDEKEYEKGKA